GLLEAVGATGKPAILSTGMATLEEVTVGIDTLLGAGCLGLVLLHCVTQYPPVEEEINLRALGTLQEAFPGHPIGFSDHYPGNLAALGAIARGACLIEKHFTTDRGLPGPDQAGSADPALLADLGREGHALWRMLGDGIKEAKGREASLRTGGRPGLYAVRDLPAGHVITANDVYTARPQGPTPAAEWGSVMGQRLEAPIVQDQPLPGQP
ncbi:MAG TPA: N-acetylneuraminate synthase family protein, partial [bacterium]|nr:N-acetylneuraminate synthase family protein [bacterium]